MGGWRDIGFVAEWGLVMLLVSGVVNQSEVGYGISPQASAPPLLTGSCQRSLNSLPVNLCRPVNPAMRTAHGTARILLHKKPCLRRRIRNRSADQL